MLAKFFAAVMVFLAGFLPSSCTSTKGKGPATQQQASSVISINSTNKNLGVLQLTNHFETCVQLGNGKSCTIKPNLIDRKDLQLIMALQSKKSDGKIAGLSVIQVMTRQGKSFEVAVGDMNLTLTPKLSE
jgi:hypothetical protein